MEVNLQGVDSQLQIPLINSQAFIWLTFTIINYLSTNWGTSLGYYMIIIDWFMINCNRKSIESILHFFAINKTRGGSPTH